MGALRTDSPRARRIVSAFLDFLKSVEPAPGVDLEGLDVVKDCLEDVFSLNSSPTDAVIKPGLLADFFASWEAGKECSFKPGLGPSEIGDTSTTTSAFPPDEGSNRVEVQISKDRLRDSDVIGVISKDELFGKFYCAMDKVNFFSTSPSGDEDPVLLAKATQFFNDAYTEIENSGKQVFCQSDLAELFKSKGNQSVHLKLYSEAIGLYTCAISLCKTNAVYYCNRAAAYMHIERYPEAIEDCLKSIDIDPNYSKAYRRLGRAYNAQGKYSEALTRAFYKALQLDPGDETIREEIQVTQEKLREQLSQAQRDRATGSSHGATSTGPSAGPTNHPFAFFPGNAPIPPELANVFNNMASAATQGHQTHERMPDGSSTGSNGPHISMGSNVTVDFGEMPGQLSDVLRSVMGMFSLQGPQEGTPGGGGQT